MGIFDRLFDKKKAMREKEGDALEKIFEKMGIPKNETAEFKARVDIAGLAELAGELVSRERSRAAGAKKVNISPWGMEQISEMIRVLMPKLRIAGPVLPVTTKLMERILVSGGGNAGYVFHVYIERAVEDLIKEDLKKATEEDIRKWQSKKW